MTTGAIAELTEASGLLIGHFGLSNLTTGLGSTELVSSRKYKPLDSQTLQKVYK
jgi:hypothetical protein